jgi:hypothetical protein
LPVSRSVLARIFSIDFWFLSEVSMVSRSVRVASRSSSTGAELSSSPSPPRLVGITGTPSGPGSVIGGAPRSRLPAGRSDVPVKLPCIVAVVPIRIGTSSFTAMRTRTKPGVLAPQLDLGDLAHRHARKGHRRAIGQAIDRLLEEDVVFCAGRLRQAARSR